MGELVCTTPELNIDFILFHIILLLYSLSILCYPSYNIHIFVLIVIICKLLNLFYDCYILLIVIIFTYFIQFITRNI